jgi:hypothetical protein
MRMDSWAIHGSNQAMNQRAQAWQRQRQQRNLNFDSECSCDWINWQSKKKRKGNRLSSVHSEGSAGMGVSWVFCLVWGLGSYLFCGLWSSLTFLSHADIHLRFRFLLSRHGLYLQLRILAHAEGNRTRREGWITWAPYHLYFLFCILNFLISVCSISFPCFIIPFSFHCDFS